jgi:outer membrane protein assembly factor BamA
MRPQPRRRPAQSTWPARLSLSSAVLLAWLLCLSYYATAQASGASAPPPVLLPGASTDTLVFVNPPCADNVRRAVVGQLLFFGNAKTRERILRAELDFQEGDSLVVAELPARLEANRRRLYNLQLFHAVTCQAVCSNGRLVIVFVVRERWYLFPSPIFSLAERNTRAWLARRDFSRVDYGLHLVQQNFRGRNEQVVLNLQHGFNRKYELFYTLPYAISRKHGLGVQVAASLYQSHSLDYDIRADRLVTFRQPAAFPIRRWYLSAALLKRYTVERQLRIGLRFTHERVTDSVLLRQPRYFGSTGEAAFRDWLEGDFHYIRNHTNAFAYPLKGSVLEAGLLPRVGLAGASQLSATVQASYRWYHPLGEHLYYAAGLRGQLRLTRTVAFADNLALGYRATVRGYDLYVMNGQHYALLRQGLTRRLFDVARLPLKVRSGTRFGDIPLAAYLNAFADVGYARDASMLAATNPLTNQLLAAVGLGLHIVSYYDRVIVVEAALNHRRQPTLVLSTGFPI